MTRELKPHEMIYWLKRVIAIPQGHINTEFALDFDFGSTALGILPEIARGTANSTFNLNTFNFESTAIGELSEV